MQNREIISKISSAVEHLYGAEEAQQIAYIIAEEVYGVGRLALLTDPQAQVKEFDVERFSTIIEELRAGRPVQYVVGECDFCGLRLAVQEGMLIPRPETEELVMWIKSEHQNAVRILDIGTGSGAIAVSLASMLPRAAVTAVDISEDALSAAERNSKKCGVEITVQKCDILTEALPSGAWDVIVSNPPYIPAGESVLMRSNVLDYEPHLALFVPDEDPLLFYRTIAQKALGALCDGGALYYEIHENFASETVAMLTEMGYSDVEVRRDINGKERMVRCIKR